jgi:Rrf2 family protein
MQSLKAIDYAMVLIRELEPTYKGELFLDAAEVARKHKLPQAFMQKIAQRLKRANIIEARRGSHGGYRLLVSPRKLSIETIALLFEQRHMWCPLIRYQKHISI